MAEFSVIVLTAAGNNGTGGMFFVEIASAAAGTSG